MNGLEQRIGVGSRLYHITATSRWVNNEDNFWQPLTRPAQGLEGSEEDKKLSQRLADHLSRKYLVCGVRKDFQDWKKHGLYDRIIKHIHPFRSNFTTDLPVVTLSFVIENEENIYVREHAHWCPKKFLELIEKDLFECLKTRIMPSEKECELFDSQLIKYIASTTPLKDYDGSFQLPEIWYPHKIPIDKITVEEVLK